MSIPRDGALIVSRQQLDQHESNLYERFVRLAEKYQYRDLARALADALLYWVEAHEHADTARPPPVHHDASADSTIQEQAPLGNVATPPPPGPDGSGESQGGS